MVQRKWWCLRGWIVLVVVSMLLAGAAFGAWARARDWEGEGDSDGKGRISNARADIFGVTVEGEMEAGSLWLGCTFTLGGTEYDQPVKNVKAGLLGRDKKFQVKFNAPSVISSSRIQEGGAMIIRWPCGGIECLGKSATKAKTGSLASIVRGMVTTWRIA